MSQQKESHTTKGERKYESQRVGSLDDHWIGLMKVLVKVKKEEEANEADSDLGKNGRRN